jgi:hypothetical protein
MAFGHIQLTSTLWIKSTHQKNAACHTAESEMPQDFEGIAPGRLSGHIRTLPFDLMRITHIG